VIIDRQVALRQAPPVVLDLRMSLYPVGVMDARETKNVSLGRTSLVVAASDGPGG